MPKIDLTDDEIKLLVREFWVGVEYGDSRLELSRKYPDESAYQDSDGYIDYERFDPVANEYNDWHQDLFQSLREKICAAFEGRAPKSKLVKVDKDEMWKAVAACSNPSV